MQSQVELEVGSRGLREIDQRQGNPPFGRPLRGGDKPRGILSPDEWQGLDLRKALVVEQGVKGQKLTPRTYAWALHNGTHLYIGIRNLTDPGSKLHTEAVWGQNDAVELAMRNPSEKGASILVLRGYPLGQFEGSTEAGAPFEVAQDIERSATYAARADTPGEWTAEWKIPLDAVGLKPGKSERLPFNLSVRKMCGPHWMMWRGTLGYTWNIDQAGVLELRH